MTVHCTEDKFLLSFIGSTDRKPIGKSEAMLAWRDSGSNIGATCRSTFVSIIANKSLELICSLTEAGIKGSRKSKDKTQPSANLVEALYKTRV